MGRSSPSGPWSSEATCSPEALTRICWLASSQSRILLFSLIEPMFKADDKARFNFRRAGLAASPLQASLQVDAAYATNIKPKLTRQPAYTAAMGRGRVFTFV